MKIKLSAYLLLATFALTQLSSLDLLFGEDHSIFACAMEVDLEEDGKTGEKEKEKEEITEDDYFSDVHAQMASLSEYKSRLDCVSSRLSVQHFADVPTPPPES